MTRKDFLKMLGLAGGGGLLYLAGTSWLRREPMPKNNAGQAQAAGTEQWQPAYAVLEAEGKLAARIEQAYSIMESCRLCPRRCGVNRRAGEIGFCQAPARAMVYSHQPHFGEELPLVGRGGSGTIFFSKCNLRCVFCQNWPIAHKGWGNEVSDMELAEMMLDLQRIGCHNINLVTPTHMMPNILGAVRIALQKGLHLPLCYNTSGYELVEMVELLDGIVDIYLPDVKFMDGVEAQRYNLAAAADYPQMAKDSTVEMHRQVGEMITDERGIALRGLMVRHLVMPNRIAGTREFVRWVAADLSKQTYVNIMSQYRVEFMAYDFPLIARAITAEEFVEAMEWAREAGLTNLDERSLSSYEIHRRRVS
ncbi:MAG TPA: radical SAM protein [Firmicutes bacterium]|nr:radical SAM protein [Bacillota bacterium]